MIELSGKNRTLKNEDFSEFLDTDRYDKELFQEADHIRQEYYGTDVYIRGLIEFTNYYRTFVLQGGEDPAVPKNCRDRAWRPGSRPEAP